MSAKGDLTPLADAGLLDEGARRRLREVGITTVEELVGQMTSAPREVADLLGLDGPQLDRLRSQATDALPPATRHAFDNPPAYEESYGALEPDED